MGLLSRAAVISVLVHLAVIGALLHAHVTPPPPRAAPIEVELRFRAPEARRVTPPLPTPTVRGGSAGPRRAVRVAPRSAPSAAPTSEPRVSAAPTEGLPPNADPPAVPGADTGSSDGVPDGGASTQLGLSEGRFVPPTEPALLFLPRIDYPPRALMDEVEGVVRLDVHLSAEGRVLSIAVLESPSSELAEAARTALMGARFRPATRNGEAIESRFPYRYRFELR